MIIINRVIIRKFYRISYIALLFITKFYRYYFKIRIIIKTFLKTINLNVIKEIFSLSFILYKSRLHDL